MGGDAPSGHGLGFGDVTGDGRGAFIVHNGWWEAPSNPLEGAWRFHQEFDLGSASVPILVADVNDDGVNELVVGQAHGYGLDYYTQEVKADGSREWTRHPIDPWFSQYHDMIWADIDGDGEPELVTGNRYRAHCGNEPGETDVVGLYYFKWNGEGFTKSVIDHGKVPDHSGTGIFMQVVDLDGNGRLDVVAPGKEGLFVFRNLGPEAVGG
ncbi:MAG: FG-GAP repeat domain-containing protein [Planctomycetota bacterium]